MNLFDEADIRTLFRILINLIIFNNILTGTITITKRNATDSVLAIVRVISIKN